ncbi:PREDICTED: uncharacterized protein LOC109148726 [Ipomoea nil]|uniref:uncharacterized protein LOC109148726 n=1 Tax=Ipomoea nil TaxID=35883 RepID=UPI00090169B8|nr:PREDICTED: uncharacterized protein LOC109148726 [Ipomoea nil]
MTCVAWVTLLQCRRYHACLVISDHLPEVRRSNQPSSQANRNNNRPGMADASLSIFISVSSLPEQFPVIAPSDLQLGGYQCEGEGCHGTRTTEAGKMIRILNKLRKTSFRDWREENCSRWGRKI